MTSDAKIGLLLGLVFIFVIAFIINGLPSFGGRAQEAEAAPTTSFENESIGLADQAQNAQERLDWQALLDQSDEPEATVATEDSVEIQGVATAGAQDPLANDAGEVRTVLPLDHLVNGVSRTIGNVVKGLSEAPEAMTMQNETQEPVPVLDIPQATPGQAERPTRAQEPPARTNPPVERLLPRKYEVQEGDVLATVAKKVYGPVEGNRLVNIRRIFQANSMVLNSPDEIFVGQTLVIPPLPEGTERIEGPNPTLSEKMFEKVEAVGRRNLDDVRASRPEEGRWYVVQDGDNLWKIAAAKLGSGARCDEIAKMNSDILKDKDRLDIGMRIRLPSK
jgi:nucleoid-associated protein YgaU